MQAFNNLITTCEALLGPVGCPWTKEQTLFTLEPYLIEEAHELIEAIDLQDPKKIEEELGDVFYVLTLIGKLGEISKIFSIEKAIQGAIEKLTRRHPHVFAQLKVDSLDEIAKNWEAIKKKEGKKNLFEGIPATLPALARAQKVISKLKYGKNLEATTSSWETEKELAERLWQLIREAEGKGLDAEGVLRRYCKEVEKNAGDDFLA